ncbi:GLPGLI family protein [Psychroserpens burtonensis]|nr:GLPGLI family protein [Psychroserpens burtonensis]
MKYYISIVLFLLLNIAFSQVKSGEVVYLIKKNEEDKSNNIVANDFKKTKSLIENELSNLKFILEFNRNESKFGIKKKLSSDNNDNYHRGLALLVTRANKVFYTDSKSKVIVENFSFVGKQIILKTDYKDLSWTLINETKEIEGYVCFKAVLEIEKESISSERTIKRQYFAWYCPELSFNFGPFESINLPGLVLEFSNDKFIFYAHKIKLSDKDLIIEEPTEGKLMTKEEFIQLGKKAFENRDN